MKYFLVEFSDKDNVVVERSESYTAQDVFLSYKGQGCHNVLEVGAEVFFRYEESKR